MPTLYFTRPGAWNGGSFEILIYLGPADEQGLKAALCRIWEHPALEGCWQDNSVEPGSAARIDPLGWQRSDNSSTLKCLFRRR